MGVSSLCGSLAVKMGNMETITLFVVALNVLMFLSGVAMADMNPDGSICYSTDGSIIGESISSSGNYSVVDNDVLNQLPDNQEVVTSGETNFFTDIFNNIVGWFKSAPGVKYVYGVVAAPYNILTCMNLPNAFVVAMGTLWYLVSFLVLLGFLWGRS